jgi:hypothetical protein
VHVDAGDAHRTGGRLVDPGEQVEQGRLAAAGTADHGQELPRRHLKIHIPERGDIPGRARVALGDRTHVDYRFAAHRQPLPHDEHCVQN